MEYVYLLQEREFIKTGENIYKIGMTKQLGLKRFSSYPKGSALLFHIACNNSRQVELQIISDFIKRFKQRKDIGTEYFEGSYVEMIKAIYEIAINDITDITDTVNMSDISNNTITATTNNISNGIINTSDISNTTTNNIGNKRDPNKIIKNLLREYFKGSDYYDDVVFGGNREVIGFVNPADSTELIGLVEVNSIGTELTLTINKNVFLELNNEFFEQFEEYEFEIASTDSGEFVFMNEILPVGHGEGRSVKCTNNIFVLGLKNT